MFTFKGKMGLGAVVAVAVLTTSCYLLVLPRWSAQVERVAKQDVRNAAKLVPSLQRLRAYDLVSLVQQIASRHQTVAAVLVPEESERRKSVFGEIAEVDRELRKQQRKADFFAIVDNRGRVIARDLNIEDMYGEVLPYAAIKRALKGRATSDVWFMKNRMMRAAAAPLLDQGKVVGAVTLAYDFTSAEARAEAAELGADVVYFLDSAVRASSFEVGLAEDSARVKVVGQVLADEKSAANRAVSEGKQSDLFTVDVQGNRHLVISAPLPEAVTILGIELSTKLLQGGRRAETITATSVHKAGYAVLVDLDERLAPVQRARWVVTLFGLGFLVILFAGMWAVSRHFVDAEDRLELGVNEIISGNMEYTFGAAQEFEGLANALNTMLARLLGRPEPGTEEDGEASWGADVISIEGVPEQVPPGVDVARLAAEPEGAYLERLFNEYLAARKAANLRSEGLSLEGFSQRIRSNEAMLKARHEAGRIRFVLRTGAGQVSLVPVVLP